MQLTAKLPTIELGLVRKPAEFTSTISDDRGSELLYVGLPVSRVLSDNLGVGGIGRCLIITADHGPAGSGVLYTIVDARADKDLVSSLASGLLTIVILTEKSSMLPGSFRLYYNVSKVTEELLQVMTLLCCSTARRSSSAAVVIYLPTRYH
ncbi:hypothetical protein ACTXT7_006634 [Hymenolepis weldensis]